GDVGFVVVFAAAGGDLVDAVAVEVAHLEQRAAVALVARPRRDVVLLALGGRRFGKAFVAASLFAIVVNGFGAFTFERSGFSKYYYNDGSQRTLHQPD
ncbi:MAG TPA: hypothetical protein PLI95_09495, partial [Polyangiaceae bacterium]|nr:hypothetical protein [Polyangiaceae bacterium]